MDDMEKAIQACQTAVDEATFISDAAARVIAAMYHDGGTSLTSALASTGYIPIHRDEQALLIKNVLSNMLDDSTMDEVLVITSLIQYILNRIQKQDFGTVPGWSNLWL